APADAALRDLGGFDLDARIIRGLGRAPGSGRLISREDALRSEREELRHRAGAEREADDMGAIELERVEQPRNIERLLAAISLRIVRLAAPAGAPRVKRDDAKILLQVGHDAGADPAVQARRAAMQQHDRLALAAVDVVDLHTIELGVLAVVGGKRGRRCEANE